MLSISLFLSETAMKIFGYSALMYMFLLGLISPVYAQYNPEKRGRPAQCILAVKAKVYIKGECLFSPIGRDGSFQIFSYDGKYFANVSLISKGIAEGSWNEESYANHAHTPLGQLIREGGCWVSNIASVCAY